MADKSNPFAIMGTSDNGYVENNTEEGSKMRSTQRTAYVRNNLNAKSGSSPDKRDGFFQDWGSSASRSMYNTFVDLTQPMGNNARSLLKSRLWKGVPQLTDEMLGAFDAAFTGHTFFFVKDVPKFMTTGIYADTNMHLMMKNLKAIIERATLSFSGSTPMTLTTDPIEDGNSQISVPTNVSKKTTEITLSVHEFAGLPVKNAIETWMTGIYDPISHHGSYHGNLGISGGWCLQNHTMSMLVVQVDPSWTEVMDAAYYNNMIPTQVPETFTYTKGQSQPVENADLVFSCNEHRSAAVMKAAEVYMNNRILKLARTAAFNSRQFVPSATLIDNGYGALVLDSGIVDNDYSYDINYKYGNDSMKSFVEEVNNNAKTAKVESKINASTTKDTYNSNSSYPSLTDKPEK